MNASGDIAFCGYGEALAYMVFREIIEEVEYKTENGKLVITLQCNDHLPIDYDLLQVPISLKVSNGDKACIVEIPYSGAKTTFEMEFE